MSECVAVQEKYLLTTFPFLQKNVNSFEAKSLLAELTGIEMIKLHGVQNLTEAAIGFVNEGKFEQALALTTYVLEKLKSDDGRTPENHLAVKLTALASRGSAFAMIANSQGEAGKERLRGKSQRPQVNLRTPASVSVFPHNCRSCQPLCIFMLSLRRCGVGR